VHKLGGPYPMAWSDFRYHGPTSCRFDHQLEEGSTDRGIFYGAMGSSSFQTCLAEVYQQNRVIDVVHHLPAVSLFASVEQITLLDLSGDFATRVGASAAINTGSRSRARKWAQLLYDAYPECQGIQYLSSMNQGAVALAIFERAAPAMPFSNLNSRELRDRAYKSAVENAAANLGYEVVGYET